MRVGRCLGGLGGVIRPYSQATGVTNNSEGFGNIGPEEVSSSPYGIQSQLSGDGYPANAGSTGLRNGWHQQMADSDEVLQSQGFDLISSQFQLLS
ncbi:hypothetical protein PM082_022172 [Marasmius tenuissimus]|nr:hypothetical protein PM082_022172 [Marasmius tenuissimus]